jgi:hypothetical protein
MNKLIIKHDTSRVISCSDIDSYRVVISSPLLFPGILASSTESYYSEISNIQLWTPVLTEKFRLTTRTSMYRRSLCHMRISRHPLSTPSPHCDEIHVLYDGLDVTAGRGPGPGPSPIYHPACHDPQGRSREVHFDERDRGAKLGEGEDKREWISKVRNG